MLLVSSRDIDRVRFQYSMAVPRARCGQADDGSAVLEREDGPAHARVREHAPVLAPGRQRVPDLLHLRPGSRGCREAERQAGQTTCTRSERVQGELLSKTSGS